MLVQHRSRLGAEGVASKRLGARYYRGARNGTWVKTRCQQRQELVVGGFTEPDDQSRGMGSMLRT